VASDTVAKSVPLGRNHRRMSPMPPSTCGFCHGAPGSQKKVDTPVSSCLTFSLPLSAVQVSGDNFLKCIFVIMVTVFASRFAMIEPAKSFNSGNTMNNPQGRECSLVGETNRSRSACKRPGSVGLYLIGILLGMSTFLPRRLCFFLLLRRVHRYRQYGFPASLYSHLYRAFVPTLGTAPTRFIRPAISSGERSFFNCSTMYCLSAGSASIFMPGRLLKRRLVSASICALIALYRQVFLPYLANSLETVPGCIPRTPATDF